MGTDRRRLDHRPVGQGHPFRQRDDPVLRHDEIVLRGAVGLESLDLQVLADIVLPPPAGIALPADQLRPAGHVLPGPELRDGRADGDHDAGILMALHDGIHRARMGTVVGVDLAAADADMLDIQEDLIPFQVFGLRGLHVGTEDNLVRLLQDYSAHMLDFEGLPR